MKCFLYICTRKPITFNVMHKDFCKTCSYFYDCMLENYCYTNDYYDIPYEKDSNKIPS